MFVFVRMKNMDENRAEQNKTKQKKQQTTNLQSCLKLADVATFCTLPLLLIINNYDAESLKYPDLMVA